MKPVIYLLDQKDRELLRKFQIHKDVHIKLIQLQANVNTKIEVKVPMIFSSSFDVSSTKIGSTDHTYWANTEHKRFNCHLCPYSSTFKNCVKQHLWTHSAYKRFHCEKCSYGTNHISDFKSHTNSKHNPNPESRKRKHPCQLCSKFFFTMSALRSHLSVHTKEKPFSCQFCSREFTTNAGKNRHETMCNQNPMRRDSVWVESQKRFQCNLCSKKMLTNAELTVHIRRHTQERPYKCDLCHYAGALTSDLKSHMDRRHNPNIIKDFACELCLKLFLTKKELYQHFRTHTKENLSACEFCKKQFVTNTTRNLHRIICKSNPKKSDEEWVNKQKTFKCQLCTYASQHKGRLKRHLRIHGGTNNY